MKPMVVEKPEAPAAFEGQLNAGGSLVVEGVNFDDGVVRFVDGHIKFDTGHRAEGSAIIFHHRIADLGPSRRMLAQALLHDPEAGDINLGRFDVLTRLETGARHDVVLLPRLRLAQAPGDLKGLNADEAVRLLGRAFSTMPLWEDGPVLPLGGLHFLSQRDEDGCARFTILVLDHAPAAGPWSGPHTFSAFARTVLGRAMSQEEFVRRYLAKEREAHRGRH